MYGCNCHIGCLSGSVTRVGADGSEFMGLSGSVTRVGDGLRGYASLVCSTNKEYYYLRVIPDTVWITDDEIQQFLVESNVTWVIYGDFTDGEVSLLDKLVNSDLITNETMLENGLMYVESFHNNTLLTNEMLVRDTSIAISVELDNGSYLSNSHYLLNKLV